MKNIKRLLALMGAVLLILLYACTLVFALMDFPAADRMLTAAVAATILVPVLLYGYGLLARVLKKDGSSSKDMQDHSGGSDQ